MGKYVGIDLGTTFSVVAYIDDEGKPRVLENSEGKNITPSTVLFENGETIVGEEAKKSSFTNPKNYEAFVKRHMGERDYVFKDQMGNEYSPEAISAIVLKKLKIDAEAALGDKIVGAVVTVPAYFNDAQRQATKQAAEMAGLNTLAIINEPTAAALAYGITKGDETPKTILIYDLGGGTFDVCIMRFNGREIETLSSEGNRELGGFDFDNKIIDYVCEKAKEEGMNVADDPSAMQALQLAAEDAKKALSSKNKTTISLFVSGRPLKVDITREQFEDMIDGLLFRTISVMETAMETAGLEYSDIDKILLVGGSTRIPAVKKAIMEETEITPSSDIHQDEAVAIGAAFHAIDVAREIIKPIDIIVDNGSKDADSKDAGSKDAGSKDAGSKDAGSNIPHFENAYTFVDRTAHGIGIVVWNEEEEKDINSIILPKNSAVPAESSQEYQTVQDYQESLVIKVTQGEEENLDYVTIIGESELKLKPKPAGNPIEVIISCDKDSIIHVRVIDRDDNDDLGEMKINRIANLTDEQVKSDKIRIGKLNISE